MSQELPEVAGRMMLATIADHERACRVLLRDEQEKPNCDTHLIGVLCDSVRLCREHVDFVASTVAVKER